MADEEKNEVQGGKPPALVFLFSLLPGAGHMYMGLMTRGLHLMVLFFGTVYLGGASGLILNELWGIVVAPVIWFFSFFDALRISGRLQRGETVVDRGIFAGNGTVGPAFWGWVLVGIGVLLLVSNLFQLSTTVMWWVRRTLPPLLLMGLGVAILWHQWQRRPPSRDGQ